MKLYILMLLVVLISVPPCFGQEPIKIYDFSGGLNTNAGLFGVAPNQGVDYLNIDLSEASPGIRPRKGIMTLTDSLPQSTPIYGVYAAIDRDGSKKLLAITDQRSTSLPGLGYLVASPDYDYELNIDSGADSLYPYMYTGAPWYWATWKDDEFISNGRQVPIVVHDEYARDLVVQAPGEPRIYPMNVSAAGTPWTGEPNGEYRYVFFGRTNCGGETTYAAVADEGFEDWTDDSTLTSWSVYNPGSLDSVFITKDSTREIEGSYCVQFVVEEDVINNAGLRDTIDVNSSTGYHFSVHGKFTELGDSSNTLHAQISERPSGAGLIVNESQKNYDSAWFELTDNFVTSDSCDSLQITLFLVNATGAPVLDTVYIDSLELQEVAEEEFVASYVSHPIKAYEELIMLANFNFHTITSQCSTSHEFWDDISYDIFRTKANPGSVSKTDTFYRVAHLEALTYSELDTLRFIDSIPDDSLGTGSYDSVYIFDDNRKGRGADTTFRVGAPTYIARNDTGTAIAINSYISLPMVDSASGADSAIDTTTLCIAYMITYTDTITGFESDSGRNLFIFIQTDTGKIDTVFDSNFVIGIPPIPSGRNHLIRNLYKSYGYTIIHDTVGGSILTGYDTSYIIKDIYVRGYHRGEWERRRIGESVDTIITALYTLDTNFTPYYRLAVFTDSSVKEFTDTLAWDSLTKRDAYYKSGAPVALNYITSFGDRAWGAEGSIIHYSYLDSGGYWSVFDGVALNRDDGDEVTAIVPDRDYMNIYKNESKFILYTDDGINYTRKWIEDGFGCIAPASMTSYNRGQVYLSKHGVVSETGSIYKDRGSTVGIISTPISDLLDYTPDQHRTAVGVIKDNKYWLSYPEKDTTYVYDFIIGAWSIYDFAFTQSTFYDTIHSSNIRPAKDMLFITSSSDRVFKADTGTFDITGSDTAAIPVEWKSGALAISRISKGVATVGLYCNPDMKDSIVTVLLYDAEGTQKDSATVTVQTSYTAQDMAEKELLNYFSIKLSNIDGSDTLATFKIDGIEIWPEDKGPSDKE